MTVQKNIVESKVYLNIVERDKENERKAIVSSDN
jgi:hypothetical protein